MSNRTLVELNHDYAPGLHMTEEEWLEKMAAYYRSGDKNLLPRGVTFKSFRHHSEPCPFDTRADKSPSERLAECLRKIGRMKTLPDHASNTFTLSIAHQLANEALADFEKGGLK